MDEIQVVSHEWTLHKSAEDREISNYRAENKDWFVAELNNKVYYYHSITKIIINRFIKNIPFLNKREKIHIQFLTAYANKVVHKVNTWRLVDV